MTAWEHIKEALDQEQYAEDIATVEKWLTAGEMFVGYVILVGDFDYSQDVYVSRDGELYAEAKPLITSTEEGGQEKIALLRELKNNG